MTSTADLCDEFQDELQALAPGMRSFGGVSSLAGEVETVRVDEDNTLVRETLSTPGDGRVLVVDSGAKHVALVGDKLATLARINDWAGIVVNGYVRDTAALQEMDVAVFALGTFPKRSFVTRAGERGVAIEVSETKVEPGMWLYADVDGIVVSARPLEP